jgi:hypothetical protein
MGGAGDFMRVSMDPDQALADKISRTLGLYDGLLALILRKEVTRRDRCS